LGIKRRFEGQGVNEVAFIDSISCDNAPALKSLQIIVKIDKCSFYLTEVESLLGDPAQAKEKLGWVLEITPQCISGIGAGGSAES
jgi:GDPmannose 4,6-dehydratase